MFARLSMRAARLLDVHFRTAGFSASVEEGGSYVVDLEAVRGLVPPLPDNSWQHIAEICACTITPMCQRLHGMIVSDIENFIKVLSELEGPYNDGDKETQTIKQEEQKSTVVPMKSDPRLGGLVPKERPQPKRRRSSASVDTPIIIPSTHPSAPSIIIIPCGSQNHGHTCRVPFQNSAFGNLLTVPSYSTFNDVFPPLIPSQNPLPLLENWRWQDGHWEAVLPSLRDQSKRGLFSRVQSLRKRTC